MGCWQPGRNSWSGHPLHFSVAYTGGNDQLAIHVDGFWRDGSDYDIPGAAELETEEEHEEEGHDDHHEGVLENSASKSEGFNVGASWLLDNGFVGLSYGRLDRLNGVPGHGHEEEHDDEEEEGEHEDEHEEDEVVLSDLTQDRWQLISELALDNKLLSEFNTRIGYTDYEHIELENGETGTIFRNETLQAKVDFLHQEFSGWRGALSVEGKTTDFEAIGEEAFTPPSTTDTFSVALVEEKHMGNILWQLGARIEKVSLEADAIEWGEEHHDEAEEEDHEHTLLHFNDLDFTPLSVSAGLVWDFTPGYNVGLALTHSQRAPTASELFSAGPHIGTGSYEVGALFILHEVGDDAHLDYIGKADEEVSNNIDISWRKHEGDIGFVVNVFYNQVSNFYYQRNTGYTSEELFEHDEEEADAHDHASDLPVYIFEQADATFYGLEAEVVWQFAAPLKLTVWGDSIRAKLDDSGNLPRIPPLRLGSQLHYQRGGWSGEVDVSHYFEQEDIAEFETTTGSYTLLDAQLAYTFSSHSGDLTVFAKGTNLTNEEARVHSSFLKDRAPLPGRGFSIGIRGMF